MRMPLALLHRGHHPCRAELGPSALAITTPPSHAPSTTAVVMPARKHEGHMLLSLMPLSLALSCPPRRSTPRFARGPSQLLDVPLGTAVVVLAQTHQLSALFGASLAFGVELLLQGGHLLA